MIVVVHVVATGDVLVLTCVVRETDAETNRKNSTTPRVNAHRACYCPVSQFATNIFCGTWPLGRPETMRAKLGLVARCWSDHESGDG